MHPWICCVSAPYSRIFHWKQFNLCNKFNSDISGWDTSSALRMNFMVSSDDPGSHIHALEHKIMTNAICSCGNQFNGCTAFDQPIGSWDVSNVQTFGATVCTPISASNTTVPRLLHSHFFSHSYNCDSFPISVSALKRCASFNWWQQRMIECTLHLTTLLVLLLKPTPSPVCNCF